MKITIKKIYGEAFRSFTDFFSVSIPENGLCLIKGSNRDTGDSSASGKSSLTLAIAYLFGGCPFSRPELQSWNTETPMYVGAEVERDGETFVIERHEKGLSLSRPKEGKISGKAAEAELTKIFGLDAKMRAMTTYRGQGQDGIFLNMDDSEKKEFLTHVLGLDKFEELAEKAGLEKEAARNKFISISAAVSGTAAISNVPPVDGSLPKDRENQIDESLEKLASSRAKLEEIERGNREKCFAECKEVKDKYVLQISEVKQELEKSLHVAIPERITELTPKLDLAKERLVKVLEADRIKKLELDKQKFTLSTQLKAATKDHVDTCAEAKKTVQATKLRISHLQDEKCPHCLQQWASAKEELEAIDLSAMVDSLKQECEHKKAVKVDLETQLAAVPEFEEHCFVPRLRNEINKLEEEIKEFKLIEESERNAAKATAKEKEAQLNKECNGITQELESICLKQSVLVKGNIREIDDNIAEFNREKNRNNIEKALFADRMKTYEKARQENALNMVKVEEAEKTYYEEDDYSVMIGREGFLGAIFDDVLDEIAAEVNTILSVVANVRHVTFDFSSEKESKSGTVQRRIVPVVSIGGKTVKLKSGCSGGMQSAINLAVDLAVGQVCSRRSGVYPGWLILDESFDGLGRVAKETCIDMLNRFGSEERTIIVIDHASEFQGQFTQVIKVASVDGKSFIENT